MPLIRPDDISSGGIPYLHGLVCSRRGNIPAIGRPCYSVDLGRVPTVSQAGSSSFRVADLYCLIIACRGYALAIGRPGHGIDAGRVAVIDQQGSSLLIRVDDLVVGSIWSARSMRED